MSSHLTTILQWLGFMSVVTFIGSLLFIPWLILRLEPDYFVSRQREPELHNRYHPLIALLVVIFRNGLGLLLLAAGIAMIFLPGQGIITLIIGLSVMVFPGKQVLLEKVVQQERVRKSLNWIRSKGGKSPFVFPVKDNRAENNS